MLEARDLAKFFHGAPVLKDVSFEITPGEVLGYLFGIASTITWDAFYLNPRDEVVLGSLPVSSRLLA